MIVSFASRPYLPSNKLHPAQHYGAYWHNTIAASAKASFDVLCNQGRRMPWWVSVLTNLAAACSKIGIIETDNEYDAPGPLNHRTDDGEETRKSFWFGTSGKEKRGGYFIWCLKSRSHGRRQYLPVLVQK
jgi:hypothetical protein